MNVYRDTKTNTIEKTRIVITYVKANQTQENIDAAKNTDMRRCM